MTLANVPLLYVPGNHDTGYEENPPLGCTPIDGKIVECSGMRVIGLGGSLRYNDRVYGFTEQEMRWRMFKLALRTKWTGGADLMVTHVPPRGYGDLDDYPHQGFEAFNVALEMLQPRILVHGHVHMEYGRIEREHAIRPARASSTPAVLRSSSCSSGGVARVASPERDAVSIAPVRRPRCGGCV